jgi:hypothetical protein
MSTVATSSYTRDRLPTTNGHSMTHNAVFTGTSATSVATCAGTDCESGAATASASSTVFSSIPCTIPTKSTHDAAPMMPSSPTQQHPSPQQQQQQQQRQQQPPPPPPPSHLSRPLKRPGSIRTQPPTPEQLAAQGSTPGETARMLKILDAQHKSIQELKRKLHLKSVSEQHLQARVQQLERQLHTAQNTLSPSRRQMKQTDVIRHWFSPQQRQYLLAKARVIKTNDSLSPARPTPTSRIAPPVDPNDVIRSQCDSKTDQQTVDVPLVRGSIVATVEPLLDQVHQNTRNIRAAVSAKVEVAERMQRLVAQVERRMLAPPATASATFHRRAQIAADSRALEDQMLENARLRNLASSLSRENNYFLEELKRRESRLGSVREEESILSRNLQASLDSMSAEMKRQQNQFHEERKMLTEVLQHSLDVLSLENEKLREQFQVDEDTMRQLRDRVVSEVVIEAAEDPVCMNPVSTKPLSASDSMHSIDLSDPSIPEQSQELNGSWKHQLTSLMMTYVNEDE